MALKGGMMNHAGGVKRYLLVAVAACLVRRCCDEDIVTKGSQVLEGIVKVLRGPAKDGFVEWEVGLLYVLMILLVLPEFVNISWLHQSLPNYILGFTLCLLFVLFDESVALWQLWSQGQFKKSDALEHHENILLSLANLALFYANLKMHSLRRALAEVSEERRAEFEAASKK
eukprot:TRINITY_DN117338_c0_g1_i1.p1 TRINITY_DN117338_c0_g1~~TRINITY_DN117338_c0_g1_i1.p1  ORF type:complete len:172 (-),score=55.05 TRINITY_DN117338_c0_g1_i1:148-663(-)